MGRPAYRPLPAVAAPRAAPLLILVNMQREHVVPGRRYRVRDDDTVRMSCLTLLRGAREAGLPVAHFRRVGRGLFFNPGDRFSSWVEDFVPRPSEMVFEHEAPSCFSCEAFERMIAYMHEPSLVLAGFGAEYTGLATSIDAFARGYRVRFVPEASGASLVRSDSLTPLIGQFAEPTALGGALALLASPGAASLQ